jgi:hypothetical protein
MANRLRVLENILIMSNAPLYFLASAAWAHVHQNNQGGFIAAITWVSLLIAGIVCSIL